MIGRSGESREDGRRQERNMQGLGGHFYRRQGEFWAEEGLDGTRVLTGAPRCWGGEADLGQGVRWVGAVRTGGRWLRGSGTW